MAKHALSQFWQHLDRRYSGWCRPSPDELHHWQASSEFCAMCGVHRTAALYNFERHITDLRAENAVLRAALEAAAAYIIETCGTDAAPVLAQIRAAAEAAAPGAAGE